MKLKFEGHTCKVFGVTFPILYEGTRPYIDISGQRAYEGDRVTYNFTIHRSDYIKINTEEIPNASFEKITDLKKLFTDDNPETLGDTDTSYEDIIEDIVLKFSLLKAEDKKIVIKTLTEDPKEQPDAPTRMAKQP